MRLSEMTDEQLIKQVEDDAVAREIFNRLVLSKLRVSDEVQALEHQRDTIQADYEKAMHRIAQLEAKIVSYESGDTCSKCQGWGCMRCCSSEAEIRACQGIFG